MAGLFRKNKLLLPETPEGALVSVLLERWFEHFLRATDFMDASYEHKPPHPLEFTNLTEFRHLRRVSIKKFREDLDNALKEIYNAKEKLTRIRHIWQSGKLLTNKMSLLLDDFELLIKTNKTISTTWNKQDPLDQNLEKYRQRIFKENRRISSRIDQTLLEIMNLYEHLQTQSPFK